MLTQLHVSLTDSSTCVIRTFHALSTLMWKCANQLCCKSLRNQLFTSVFPRWLIPPSSRRKCQTMASQSILTSSIHWISATLSFSGYHTVPHNVVNVIFWVAQLDWGCCAAVGHSSWGSTSPLWCFCFSVCQPISCVPLLQRTSELTIPKRTFSQFTVAFRLDRKNLTLCCSCASLVVAKTTIVVNTTDVQTTILSNSNLADDPTRTPFEPVGAGHCVHMWFVVDEAATCACVISQSFLVSAKWHRTAEPFRDAVFWPHELLHTGWLNWIRCLLRITIDLLTSPQSC